MEFCYVRIWEERYDVRFDSSYNTVEYVHVVDQFLSWGEITFNLTIPKSIKLVPALYCLALHGRSD